MVKYAETIHWLTANEWLECNDHFVGLALKGLNSCCDRYLKFVLFLDPPCTLKYLLCTKSARLSLNYGVLFCNLLNLW